VEKSNATTDKSKSFFGTRHARFREWGWACLLVAAGAGNHLWRTSQWEANLENVPQANASDLMCWLEDFPTYVMPQFKPKKGRSRGRAAGELRDAIDRNQGVRAQEVVGYGDLAPVELNSATSDELQVLIGIGPVLSARTVKYREALGGFASVDQWAQVYGLDSAVFASNRFRVRVDTLLVRPMCLDSMTFFSLRTHPLFDANAARRVLRAWGRGDVNEDVFWTRLQPSSTERAAWAPYLHVCESGRDTSGLHR